MRLMIMKNGKFVMDGSNCEYAAKTISIKLYKDRLKLVLGGYSYIKQIIDSCLHLDERDILDIKVPYLQIMGFKAVVSIVRIQDKGLFVTEDLMSFCFPFSKKQIRTGAITEGMLNIRRRALRLNST
ncbi:MAG: hypothetical protein JSY10_12190 [Paenibacillus sp.]|nr:hypothetical protein [Paenibacillus sp.]